MKPRKTNNILLELWEKHEKKFLKYSFNNFTGTIIDTFFLWLLSNFIFSTYVEKYIIAPSISFEIAMLKNYFTSYFWIWKEDVKKRVGDFLTKLFFYNVNSVFTFLAKLGLIILIERLTHLNVIYCNLIALLFTGLINYFIQDKIIFRNT